MSGGGKNRIMIYGPKDDGTYVVEFGTAEGEGAGELAMVSSPSQRLRYSAHFFSNS
jgi:hypothetical protein